MKDKEYLRQYARQQLRACQIKQLDILKEIDRVCKEHGIAYWLDGGTLLGAKRHGGFIPWDDDIDIAMGCEDLKRFCQIAPSALPATLFLQTPESDPNNGPIIKVRDLNSLYIEHGDDFETAYVKGIYVDIFPFMKHPDVPRSWIKHLHVGLSKSYSILHRKHYYSLRSFAEFFWFGAKYLLYTSLWCLLCACWPSHRYANIPIINGYGITHQRETVLPLGTIHFEDADFPAPHDADQYLRNIYGDYMQMPPEEKRKVHAEFILNKLM